MKFQWKNILSLFAIGLFANIISWWIVYFQIHPTYETVPLHYNVFYGTDQAGSGYYLYAVPLVGFAILAFNYAFYRKAVGTDRFIANAVAAASLASQVVVLIAVLFLKSRITL